MNYADFIANKMHQGADRGFEPTFMPDGAFDFQKAMIEYAVRNMEAAVDNRLGMNDAQGDLLDSMD